MIYLDTSAIVKLVAAEQESASLIDWLNARREESLVTSVIGHIELMRAIARTRPDALIRAGNVASTIDTLVLTGAVAATAATIPPAELRGAVARAGLPKNYVAARDRPRAGGDDAIRPAFPATPSGLAPYGWPVYRLHQEVIGIRRKHPWLHRAQSRGSIRREIRVAGARCENHHSILFQVPRRSPPDERLCYLMHLDRAHQPRMAT